jgi:hypothetical protein
MLLVTEPIIEKKYYFLCGMPRAGNTLFASLVNQNSQVKVTSNSIVSSLLYNIVSIKQQENFINFPDHESIDNVLRNLFDVYYMDWQAKNIIDRSSWGTPCNLSVIKQIFNDVKFIVLYRPVLECLASFVKINKPDNVEKFCDLMMKKDSMIEKSLWSIKNLIKEKENHIIIHYDNFIADPIKEIKRAFSFLNIEYSPINLNSIEQLKLNNVQYDDSFLNMDLHTIRTDEVKLNKYKIEDYLPSSVIKKYSNLDI